MAVVCFLKQEGRPHEQALPRQCGQAPSCERPSRRTASALLTVAVGGENGGGVGRDLRARLSVRQHEQSDHDDDHTDDGQVDDQAVTVGRVPSRGGAGGHVSLPSIAGFSIATAVITQAPSGGNGHTGLLFAEIIDIFAFIVIFRVNRIPRSADPFPTIICLPRERYEGEPVSETFPKTFGRYKLLELLGKGGMARVYRAVLPGPMGFEKEVAIKIVEPSFTDDEAKKRLFVNEARLGGRLKHRNIVEIYDFGAVEGQFFLAMELVDGWELRKILGTPPNAQALPQRVALEVMIEICKGLDYAHQLRGKGGALANLVHRDLKPSNVLVSRTGDVKVMDFGIAKAEINLFHTQTADVTRGTPPYMSPEQTTKNTELDARSDLFAAGAILHELLTGQNLFVGGSLIAMMLAVIHCETVDPPKGLVSEQLAQNRLKVHLPEIRAILDKCIRVDREQRYASAAEMMCDLQALLPHADGQSLEEWLEDNPHAPRRAVDSLEGPGPTRDQAPVKPAPIEKAQEEPEVERPRELRFTLERPAVTPDKPVPTPIRPNDPLATRAQQPAQKRPEPSPHLRLFALVGVVLLLLGTGLVLLTKESAVPVVESAVAVETPAPEETPTAVMSLAEEITMIPKPTPEPTPEPTPARVVQHDPTPTPVVRDAMPESTPEVETPRTGTVTLNARPWAEVFINGTRVGKTPLQDHQLAAGDYVAELRCATCEGEQRKVIEFTLEPGGTFRQTRIRFDSAPNDD